MGDEQPRKRIAAILTWYTVGSHSDVRVHGAHTPESIYAAPAAFSRSLAAEADACVYRRGFTKRIVGQLSAATVTVVSRRLSVRARFLWESSCQAEASRLMTVR